MIDLSANMLHRAVERLGQAAPAVALDVLQADIRDVNFQPASLDPIVAAAVLHHLRAESEWTALFGKLFGALCPGGSLWIWDFIEHDIPGLQQEIWARYGEYHRKVFAYTAYAAPPGGRLHRRCGPQARLLRRPLCHPPLTALP